MYSWWKPYQSTATYCWALIIIMPVKLVIHHEPQKKDPVQNWDLWQVALLLALAQQSLIKSPESQISQKSSTFKIHEPVFPMTMTMTRHNSRGTCVLQIAIYVEYRRSRKSCIVALWILRALFDKPCIETTGSDKSYYSTCFFQFYFFIWENLHCCQHIITESKSIFDKRSKNLTVCEESVLDDNSSPKSQGAAIGGGKL